MISQKRDRWIKVCVGFGIFWTALLFIGFFPAFLLAPLAFGMALLPVGMSDQPKQIKHDPLKWANNKKEGSE